eukprot:TRINITY_DN3222_c0_g1_i11.p2 TRINITY_DN3222_c0_g1~~TRINITY_DN3222_c0_g1_i11.p2  ORF type:complete len:287 (+),score=70.18 TRINITY_DN3222_c0_g1_i11:80-940(+)
MQSGAHKEDEIDDGYISERQYVDPLVQEGSALVATKMFAVWTLADALMAATQLGPSACGATAVYNVLRALKVGIPSSFVMDAVRTRLRDHSAPLAQYLRSRSVAGTTHLDLIQAVQLLTQNSVKARFFPFSDKDANTEAIFSNGITNWLYQWLRKGAVPVVTLNPQQVSLEADAWHHQMIFGVTDSAVLMTNPLEALDATVFQKMAVSSRVLRIKREDVINRLVDDVTVLYADDADGARWKEMQVAEQVEEMLRNDAVLFITIPASYISGVTLFATSEAEAFRQFD